MEEYELFIGGVALIASVIAVLAVIARMIFATISYVSGKEVQHRMIIEWLANDYSFVSWFGSCGIFGVIIDFLIFFLLWIIVVTTSLSGPVVFVATWGSVTLISSLIYLARLTRRRNLRR